MAVIKSRGATKRLGPIGLGRKFVSFKTRNCNRHFTVHEDLLCANSKFFRRRLQRGRKAVDGDCPICHESLDPKVDITFCGAKYGQNVHGQCIDQWKNSQASEPTCPMCRSVWISRRDELVSLQCNLDVDAVQIYLNWLYSGNLHIDDAIDRDDDRFNTLLLKAWTVALAFNDYNFKYAIIAEFVSSVEDGKNSGFKSDSVRYAFEECSNHFMQYFVVGDILITITPKWFQDHASEYPTSFTHALCETALRLLEQRPTRTELLEEYTYGAYTMKEEDGQEEDDE